MTRESESKLIWFFEENLPEFDPSDEERAQIFAKIIKESIQSVKSE